MHRQNRPPRQKVAMTIGKPFDIDMQPPIPNSQPAGEDIDHIARCLAELRDAWVLTSQALRDYHFSLESPERQVAAQRMEHLLQRSRSRRRLPD